MKRSYLNKEVIKKGLLKKYIKKIIEDEDGYFTHYYSGNLTFISTLKIKGLMLKKRKKREDERVYYGKSKKSRKKANKITFDYEMYKVVLNEVLAEVNPFYKQFYADESSCEVFFASNQKSLEELMQMLYGSHTYSLESKKCRQIPVETYYNKNI